MARPLLIVNPTRARCPRTPSPPSCGPWGASTRTPRPRGTPPSSRGAGNRSAIYVFSGDGGFNEVLNGVRARRRSGSSPAAGRASCRARLGLPRTGRGGAAGGGRTHAPHLPRPCQRTSLRLQRGSRPRRRADPRRRAGLGTRRGSEPTSAFALGSKARRRGAAGSSSRCSRCGHGRTAFLLVANCDPYTYAGSSASRRSPGSRAGSTSSARAASRRSCCHASPCTARGRGQERDPDVLYLHDADRIEAVCDTPTPLQVDGDLGDVTEVVFEAERDAAVVLTGLSGNWIGAPDRRHVPRWRPRSRQYARPCVPARGTCRVSSIATSSRTGP